MIEELTACLAGKTCARASRQRSKVFIPERVGPMTIREKRRLGVVR
jgi:hypothetical protein